MSASSTSPSSATTTPHDSEGEHHLETHHHRQKELKELKEPLEHLEENKEKRIYGHGGNFGANSTMSTLDRSHYQSLPLNGTRRVTVLFGEKRIVVPWKESDSTVGELAEAALRRYKKTMGLMEEKIRVLRLECASDGGILDMDDVLEEVFDLNFDQILAITDEASGSSTPTYTQIQKSRGQHQDHHYAQPLPYSRGNTGPSTPVASAFGSVSVHNSATPSPYGLPRREGVVEVSNFESAPPSGLRVSQGILRSSLRTDTTASGGNGPSTSSPFEDFATPTKQSRVTLSPEVEKKLAEQENGEKRHRFEKNPGRFARGSDRKSRINDALLEAREKIVEKLEDEQVSKPSKKARMEQGPLPATTLLIFPPADPESPEEAKLMGIEVNAVFDEASDTPSTSAGPSSNPSRLSAIQVMKIEEGGRIARDGRLKVGDCIREIDGRPVSQMSIIRARACIGDMAFATKDASLLINRSMESFLEQEAEERAAAETKPILSALQQANSTQYIGHTTVVELIKSSNGFGFTVTGRETAKGERLFYIGTVKPHGVALGHLKSGDRLLEINGESAGQFSQSQIVEKLKEAMVGEKIKFLVSRVSSSLSTSTSSSAIPTSSDNKENEGIEHLEKKKDDFQLAPVQKTSSLPLPALLAPPTPSPTLDGSRFDLVIPVNGSGSAGLGIALKARVSKKSNGTKEDCGIFIKKVLHGGAAFKEGRLRVDDRIVSIEGLDLEAMNNDQAARALAEKLREIHPTSQYVKLTVLRSKEGSGPGPISRDSSRITVDAPSPAPSSRMSTSVLQSPMTRSSGVHSRQSSSNSSSAGPRHQQMSSVEIEDSQRMDESEMMPDIDPFDREAPGRKSLSEKRGLGAAADPQHIKLFQEIKHQRQNSAPTSSTQKRSKSQPRSLSQRNYRSPMKLVDVRPEAPAASTMPRHPSGGQHHLTPDDSDMLNRRSQSMESINRPIESILRGTGQVTQSQANSKVQFMAGPSSSNGMDHQHPFPPGGSALMRLKNEESRARDKSRRKSVGNAMRNFFGFGSKSRDASPEKSVQMTERPRPIMEKMGPPPPPPPPHQQRRGSGSASGPSGGVYVDYGEPYGLVPQYPHNSTSGYESYADSELYDRYAAHRYQPPSRGGAPGEEEYGYRNYRPHNHHHSHQQQGTTASPYVNYGLPASHAYHVDARLPSSSSQGGPATASSSQQQQIGGSVSSASMRRVYPVGYDDAADYYNIQGGSSSQRYRNGPRSADYHHMFNSWFAYSGGGAAGVAPLLKSSSPVRIAAASGISEGPAASSSRGRSTSSGAIASEKYADARNGGSTRLFIPRHGGGLSAAAFGGGFGGPESPGQFRRNGGSGTPTTANGRFSQY